MIESNRAKTGVCLYTFRASYTEMGDELIMIVPKNYHNDIKKMSKPIEVIVKDLEAEE
jgi:exopolysaccharide biosynthesis predicted pyruvyltransferase EpsI